MLKTENVLKDFQQIEEKDYILLIERYFIEVRKQSDNTSQPILKAIKNLDFGLVDFELIENRKTESVFIQLNERAKKIWEKYVEIYSKKDIKPWVREEEFSAIKSEFYDFVINVPIPYDKTSIDFDSEKQFNFYVSEYENPSRNYHYSDSNYFENIGYVNCDDTVCML
jgi:CRISPR-associated endonuclease/helicase Cas3